MELLSPAGALVALAVAVPLLALLALERRARAVRGVLGLAEPGRRSWAIPAAARRVDARDLEVRREAQCFAEIRRGRAANLLVRDHVHRRRRLGEPLRLTRDGKHLDVAELLERQVREAYIRLAGCSLLGVTGERAERGEEGYGPLMRETPHGCVLWPMHGSPI